MPETVAPIRHATTVGSGGRRVLVVEQHADDAEAVAGVLRRHGYAVHTVGTGSEALRALTDGTTDLVLIDLDLPDVDGLDVCRSIRAAGDTPVIAVSRRATELDRVLGLHAGADDYLAKPYGFRELIARMAAVMRRMRRDRDAAGSAVVRGGMRIDPVSRRVTVGGQDIDLARKEFELLYLLASRAGAVVPRRQIMEQVWGDTWSRRTLDTHVSSLRGKLGCGDWIVTVRGVGFRFSTPAAPIAAAHRSA